MKTARILPVAAVVLAVLCTRPCRAELRRVVPLDGTWQIADGAADQPPSRFDRTIPVPGLADMAQPPFDEVGTEESQKLREAFWYRREFTIDGPVPAVARLKLHKAKYGTSVYLNGKLVGDHLPCFTPAIFSVADALKGDGQPNELLVRVGSGRQSVPRSIPDGWDFEKVRYIPGIYDSVELILSGTPHVVRVQTVPDIEKRSVRVVSLVENAGPAAEGPVTCRVCEAASGRPVGQAASGPMRLGEGEQKTVELVVPLADCRLWSPEDPFLYRLEVATAGDLLPVRFGMRTFRFDPASKMALLNGKPYPLRGTNVCIYRFFEDPARGDLPWRDDWVRRLHKLFGFMHWNSARYCIGFPPEKWYDVADEEGILIQDEFPIWFLGQWPAELKSDELVREYTAWMQERWNHPCVVIWDAQNESRTDETGKAIGAVRGLDLSGRPWDNGWSPPQAPGDVFEAHPYPFYSAKGPEGKPAAFRLKDFAGLPGAPGAPGVIRGNVFNNTGGNPVVINEYGWLWLNRDGTPTTLSRRNYEALLGRESTEAQRRELYARYLAAMTEFWRCRRQVAGVLHFCGLGYSRPGGETSDHFLSVEKLALDPQFVKYVRDAFAPVGLMIDYWADTQPPGPKAEIPVVVINDLDQPWQGRVTLQVLRGGRPIGQSSQPCRVEAVGSQRLALEIDVPNQPGQYTLKAELRGADGRPVASYRDASVAEP